VKRGGKREQANEEEGRRWNEEEVKGGLQRETRNRETRKGETTRKKKMGQATQNHRLRKKLVIDILVSISAPVKQQTHNEPAN
jgi:hypothetical protein